MSYLLHDTSLSLGEGDVATGLILDELDLDLSALTATLLIVIIVIFASHGSSAALVTTSTSGTKVIARRRLVETGVRVRDVGHCRLWLDKGVCKGYQQLLVER
jgi:hypothetical protein